MKRAWAVIVVLILFSVTGNDLQACTVFTVSKDGSAFFTGNNDYITTDSILWVSPGDGDHYGVLFFGQPDNIQQGFNESGLVYDSNGLPDSEVTTHEGTEPPPNRYTGYAVQILKECATVEDVILWVTEHRWPPVMWDQQHFADASGDAVVISVGAKGHLVFTRKSAGNSYLLSTNFNVANPENGSYPCDRYETAGAMLEGLVSGDQVLTAEAAAGIAEAVHVESPFGRTLYTLSADLTAGKLYVYYMFQYGNPVVLDIRDEITRAEDTRTVSSLFPEEVLARARRDLVRVRRRPVWAILAGVAGAGAGLFGLFRSRRTSRIRRRRFLLAVFILLGCLGVAVLGLGITAEVLAQKAETRAEGEYIPPDSCTTLMIEKDGDVS